MIYKNLYSKKTFICIVFILSLITSYYYFFIYKQTKEINVYAAYRSYETTDALYNGAELVVLGTPLKDFDDREHIVKLTSTGAAQDFYTLTDIKIEKIIKGPSDVDPKLTSLKVIEPISLNQQIDGLKKISYDGYQEMKKESKYIIFLKKNTYGQYSVINMQNGKFNTDNTDPSDLKHRKQEDIDLKLKMKNEILNKYAK